MGASPGGVGAIPGPGDKKVADPYIVLMNRWFPWATPEAADEAAAFLRDKDVTSEPLLYQVEPEVLEKEAEELARIVGPPPAL